MMKAIKIILGLIFAFVLIVLMIIHGNPVSNVLVNINAKAYLRENYQDTDFEIERVDYDFKTCNYYARVKSPSSADSSFTLCAGLNGKIGYDSYENLVVERWNTANRINDDYRSAVNTVLRNPEFPYGVDIGFGDIEFANSDALADEATPDYAVKTESLELDKNYDVNDFGSKAGHLTVYVFDEIVSYENLAKVLLEIKNLMDEANVSFFIIDCVLEYPKPEDMSQWNDDRVEVMGMLYDEIYEDGLAHRVKESDEKAKAYYKAQDELKLGEEIL
jgi:hypothetical protein